MNRTKFQVNLSTLNASSDGVLGIRIAASVVKNPQLGVIILRLIIKLAEWAFENMVDDNGKFHAPRWMRFLTFLGVKQVGKLKEICQEACEFVETNKIA